MFSIMTFEEKRDEIPIETLRNYLLQLKRPCYESTLLKVAFNIDTLLDINSLTLYQNHFTLFHVLYDLQKEFYEENKYLHIHFMRTFLTNYPKHGRCRYYDEFNGRFCEVKSSADNPNYCEFHKSLMGELEITNLSNKYFYMDRGNFYKLDEESAEEFVNGSWEILSHYEDYKRSFKILNLPESSDLKLVKNRFRKLAKEFHPDKGGENSEKFNEINNAYRLLVKLLTSNKNF